MELANGERARSIGAPASVGVGTPTSRGHDQPFTLVHETRVFVHGELCGDGLQMRISR
jgi:hypothetical protein